MLSERSGANANKFLPQLPRNFEDNHKNLVRRLVRSANIIWGEHCSECSQPACYFSCDFYTPKSDMHCRRFVAGFEPIDGQSDFSRIRFRKWGKIEANVKPSEFVFGAKDRLISTAAKLPFAPYLLKRKAQYLEQQSQLQNVRFDEIAHMDCLLIEAFSIDGNSHTVTINVFNPDYAIAQMFQTRFEINEQLGSIEIPIVEISKFVDLSKNFLVQIEPLNGATGRDIAFGICDFVKIKPDTISSKPAKQAKLVVWDLDETLWHGILAEDGIEGLKLRDEAIEAIKNLDERGVLHSIASKNDEDNVLAALKHFGIEEYFLAPQINWGPKSNSIKMIAETLSLGIDSFVFIDDQPFERAEVSKNHANMRVYSEKEITAVKSADFMPKEITDEGKNRRKMYMVDAKRQKASAEFAYDYEAFLKNANMTLEIDALNDKNMARIYELSQRTNQLNFNGYKYSREELENLKTDANLRAVAMTAKDDFGEYGLIGFVVFEPTHGKIHQFFMSCRAQKKRVEHGFFEWLRLKFDAAGATSFETKYTPTERNKASKIMLEDLGFEDVGEIWKLKSNEKIKSSEIVKIIDNSGV